MSTNALDTSDSGAMVPAPLFGALGMRARVVSQRFPSASQGLFSIFDQAIVSGTAFLTAAIIGRATSQHQLGLYYLMLSIVIVVSGIQDQLITSPYAIYSKRRSGRELAEYAGSMWFHYLILTLITVAGILIALFTCVAIGKTNYLPGLVALLFAGPIMMLRECIRRFTFANLHVKTAILIDATVCVAQLGGLVLLAYFEWMTLFSIFAVMGGACVLACVLWYIVDRPDADFVPARFKSDWSHNWSFGKWALRSFLVGNTATPAMLWILELSLGAAEAGVFGACATIMGISNVIVFGVCNVLTPQAAHAFHSGGAQQLQRILLPAAAFFLVTLGAFALFVFLTGDWLTVVIFGPEYYGTGPILIALVLSALLNSLGMVAGNGLWAIDQPRFNFFADVCCMTVTIAGAAVLIHPFGDFGAALATLAGTAAAAVVRIYTFFRQLKAAAVAPSIAAPSRLSL